MSNRTTRVPASDFQKQFARDFGDAQPDPVTVRLLNEVAQRLANTSIWPPGICFEIGKTIADVVGEVQTIPDALTLPPLPISKELQAEIDAEQTQETVPVSDPAHEPSRVDTDNVAQSDALVS
jgi:hypothetical protein